MDKQVSGWLSVLNGLSLIFQPDRPHFSSRRLKMVIDAENVEMHQVRDFIAANWSLFTSHIRQNSMTDVQAQRIFVAIGGEE
ncbi:hypothetical protein J6187_003779 [Salmonella enterica]|nr:hypothetical protein [Salmonella enterica]EHG9741802.1 hypothetical protein [Salmonella enterica]